MTEAPTRDAFDADNTSELFAGEDRDAAPSDTRDSRRTISSIEERLRALEAFSAA